MEPRILRPKKRNLEVNGKIFYRESIQAWNTIRFKREFINEFPDLMEKRSKFSYKMLFYRTYPELEKIIKAMKKANKPLPIFLFLMKDQEANF